MEKRFLKTPRFKTLKVDCPWSYANFKGAEHGAAESAMITQTDGFLLSLAPTVQGMTDHHCLMFFWATWPKLKEAFQVLEAWGFEYVTGWPWIKTVATEERVDEIYTGIGHWSQSVSELLLIARKKGTKRAGKPSPPVMGLMHGEDRQFYCRRDKRHSRKPMGMHQFAKITGEGPYGELFARYHTPGWYCYGEELGTWVTPEGIQLL